VDEGLADLQRVGGLPLPAEAEAIWRGIWHEETHNSTAIEGNTLVLQQVRTLLEQGRAVGNKDLREYLEVQAYGAAAQWVYQHAVGGGDWSGDEVLTTTELRYTRRPAGRCRRAGGTGHQVRERRDQPLPVAVTGRSASACAG